MWSTTLRNKNMKMLILSLILVVLLHSSTTAKELVQIKDMAGRPVTIPKDVMKIVALHGSLRYVVYLQAFEKVVAVEGIEKQSTIRGNLSVGKAYWNVIKDNVKALPSIGEGGPGKLPDLEKLLHLTPDIVITFDVDSADLIQRRTGIPVVVLEHIGTEGFNIERIMSAMTFLARILGKEHRAADLNNYISNSIHYLTARSKNLKTPTVYVGAISARGSHGITSTEGEHAALQWINVKNVVSEIGKKGHLFIDKEKLLLWDPEYIFIDTGGLNIVNQDYLKNSKLYKRLKAVKEGKVYTVYPYNFYRTNLEILLANAFFMGKTIHPAAFSDIDLRNKAKEIFIKFLGMDIFDDLRSTYKGYGKANFKESGITVTDQ